MAEEAAAPDPMGKTPEALGKRQSTVTLSDGTTVKVYKWSPLKFKELLLISTDLEHVPKVAVESVHPDERKRVEGLDFEDLLAISTAAAALNVTPGVLKNFSALLDQAGRVTEAVGKGNRSPSSQS